MARVFTDFDEDIDWGTTTPEPEPAAAPDAPSLSAVEAEYPEEGDPLSDEEPEPPEPAGLIEYDSGADSENEREFMAIKPWLGNLYPPRKFREEPDSKTNLKSVFSEDNNNWGVPDVHIELDYIFGLRTRNCRSMAHWITDKRVVYFAGAVCVVYKLDEDDQDFYFGHDDDVICMDYHEGTGLCASGSLGARDRVRLCIWDAHTLKTKHTITGFHMFAVTSVWINPAGTMVASLGMDEHHSVALHCIETGALLACSQVDKNRVLLVKWNSSLAPDSNACFVTCGVKHICFWTPRETARKGLTGKSCYDVATEDVDKRLQWYRGTKCSIIDSVTFLCMEHTPKHTLVGANTGQVLGFDSSSYVYTFTLALGKSPVQDFTPLLPGGRTIAVGTKDGFIRIYDVTDDDKPIESKLVQTGGGQTVINLNLLDRTTRNESEITVNSVRSLAYHAPTKQLLVGTILSHLYAISLPQSTKEHIASRTLVGAHWGLLKKPDGYGEIWGIDAHPTQQWIYSTAMDGTVRLWDLEANHEIERKNIGVAGIAVTASADGTMVAVGHMNGSFTVLTGDLTKTVWPNTRQRVRRVKDVQFSPNSRYLALGTTMEIDIYSVTAGDTLQAPGVEKHKTTQFGRRTPIQPGKVFTRIAICKGHTSFLRHIDWNLASNVIQTTSTGCELLYFSIPDGRRVTGAKQLADQQWWSQTCEFGWTVQGIWPRFSDATDVNSCGVSHSGQLLATTTDFGEVHVYNFPCVGSGLDKFGRMEHRPQCHVLKGHSSHVTNCVWTQKDKYLITTGGADLCIFVWKVTYRKQPEVFLDPEFVMALQKQIDEATRSRGGADLSASPLTTGVLPRDVLTSGDPKERLKKLQERISRKQRPDEPVPVCRACEYVFQDLLTTTCPLCMLPRKILRGAEDLDKPPKIIKAPTAKASKKHAFVDGFEALNQSNVNASATMATAPSFSPQTSHVMRPTRSFTAQVREARKARLLMSERPPPPKFVSTVRNGITGAPKGSKAKCAVDTSSDDSEHDERLIRAALAKSKRTPLPRPAGESSVGPQQQQQQQPQQQVPHPAGQNTVPASPSTGKKRKTQQASKQKTCGPDFVDI